MITEGIHADQIVFLTLLDSEVIISHTVDSH